MLVMLFIGSIFTLSGQGTNSIYGKWIFHDATEEEKSKLDSAGVAMLSEFFGDMYLELNKNGSFEFNYRNNLNEGTWDWDNGHENIELVSKDGEVLLVNVANLNEKTVVFSMSEGEFVMMKDTAAVEKSEPVPLKPVRVSATIEQVTKKWYLKSRTGGYKSRYRQEVDQVLSKGLYMKLRPNGKFQAEVLIVEDRAKWHFGADNKSIIISSESGSKIWYILAISENEMKLQRGNSNEIWAFSTKFKD